MKHKNSHLLVGYWSRLRKGRDVPDQTDIDPRAIKRLLSYTFILDCENPGRPVYRLAGTALCERFGFELKGTGFLAHWEAQSGLSLSPLLRQALKLRQPVCLSSIAATADNGMVELETILTPVSFNGGEPKRFFGLVQMLSDPTPLLGRAIAYERMVSSELIEEGEPLCRNMTATSRRRLRRRPRNICAPIPRRALSQAGGVPGQPVFLISAPATCCSRCWTRCGTGAPPTPTTARRKAFCISDCAFFIVPSPSCRKRPHFLRIAL